MRILLCFLMMLLMPANAALAGKYKVAVFDFDDRMQEEQTVAQYIQQQLENADPGINIEQFSGKGDEAHSVEVFRSLDRAGYDLIITITSDALILAQHILTQTPVLYTNVNNPLSLGFKTLEPPGGNISGASYYVPIEKQVELYLKIQPDIRTIGLIFDRYNKSRKVELPEVRAACNKAGIKHQILLIEEKTDLLVRVEQSLRSDVDAIVATSSDKIYDNLWEVISLCNDAGVPIYSFNKEGVKHGAVAALASDYYRMVDELILPMALRVLREKISPGSLPAAFLKENVVYLNPSQIDRLGLTVPNDILGKAIRIP